SLNLAVLQLFPFYQAVLLEHTVVVFLNTFVTSEGSLLIALEQQSFRADTCYT
ncbi:unnamed protein product, partial [Callosobruchus maculatus]